MKLKVIKEIIIQLDCITGVKRYLHPGEVFVAKPTENGIMINVDGLYISPYKLDINNFKII